MSSGASESRRVRDRLDAVRRALRDRHAGVEPDAGFADRVVARLETPQPVEVAGRLAWRLLPATVAVAAVLAWFALTATPVTDLGSTADAVAPSDDPLSWVLGIDETAS